MLAPSYHPSSTPQNTYQEKERENCQFKIRNNPKKGKGGREREESNMISRNTKQNYHFMVRDTEDKQKHQTKNAKNGQSL